MFARWLLRIVFLGAFAAGIAMAFKFGRFVEQGHTWDLMATFILAAGVFFCVGIPVALFEIMLRSSDSE